MINTIKYNQLGEMKIDWLHARHHFSFANYHNPKRMGFGVIRVINDDIVKAGYGFDTHPHNDMEIITYVRKGAITHKDSNGNKGVTQSGHMQVMSAGTGVYHSEHNKGNIDTKLYQIWIEPHTLGLKPSWDAMEFSKTIHTNTLPLLVSGMPQHADTDCLKINQYATIHGGRLAKDSRMSHAISGQAYLLVSEGEVEVNSIKLSAGDGCEITDEASIELVALTHNEVLIIDVPD